MSITNDVHANSLWSILDNSLLLAQEKLGDFLIDGEFERKIQLAFGDGVDVVTATSLVQELVKLNASVLPKFEIRDESEINGAKGAFSSINNTVYLSKQFLEENASNISSIATVVVEELGHFIDAQLNATDTQGDEGELFTNLVQGAVLREGDLQRIKAEDDSAIVTIDGQTFQIEQSNFSTGLIQGSTYYNSSIYWYQDSYGYTYSNPQDYFTFSTSGIGGFNNFINLYSNSSQVNLNLELYNQEGDLIALPPNSSSNNETIYLGNLASGNYVARVYAQSPTLNFGEIANYTLTFYTPLQPDVYDSSTRNDILPNATPFLSVANLNTSNGNRTISNLSIDNLTDVDWFKFTTTSIATSEDFIQINFNNSAGNLDVILWYQYDGYWYPYYSLDQSSSQSGTNNYEILSLAGLPTGEYYVQVGSYNIYGHTNPNYSLTIHTPKTPDLDSRESNNTFTSASNLGTIGGLYTENLSIHSSSDRDVFKFQINGIGTFDDFISINFDNAKGNLALALYDSNYNFLGYSDYYYSDTETVSLAGLRTGTYYAEVYSYTGNTNDYTLIIDAPGTTTNITSDRFEANNTFGTAKDLGTVRGSSSIPYLSIGNSSDVDWFKFSLESTGIKDNFVAIAFDTYQGDLDLRLYNSSGTLLKSATGVRDVEQLNLEGLVAGTYYVEIKGYNGATNGNYSLIFDAPGDPYEENDTQTTATNLGQIASIKTFDNLSVKSGDDDWFRFRLTSMRTQENFVRLDFLHELGNVDFALYQNTNGGGSSDPSLTSSNINLVLKQSSTGVKNSEEISLAGLSAGEYFLKIYNFNNTDNIYNLTINAANADEFEVGGGNNTRLAATDLNSNQRIQAQGYIDNSENPLSIHQATDEDWYKFTLSQVPKDGDFAAIVLDTTQGDIDLELYNSSGTKLTGSYGVSNSHRINLEDWNLQANTTYYLRVFSPTEATDRTNPAYRLVLDAPLVAASSGDAYETNNTRTTASDLGGLSNTLSRLSIHNATDEDWFKFNLANRGGLSDAIGINFNHQQGDLDIFLYDSNNNLIKTSEGVSNNEEISLAGLAAGDYYLKVDGYNNTTNPDYTLSLNLPGNKDWAEGTTGNDTAGTAKDLRNVEGLQTWQPLSIHAAGNEDWFKFNLTKAATKDHYAAILFDTAAGDLDFYLYSLSNTTTPIKSSATGDSLERIDLSGLASGQYLLKVVGNNNATNPSYQLLINAPAEQVGDWSEPNNSTSSPYNLREVQGTQTYSGLSLHESTDEDWFTFTTVGTGVKGHSVSIDFDNTEGNLNLQVIAPNGTTYTSAYDSNRERISLETLPAGTYKVRVYGTANPNYSLIIDAPQTPEADWVDENTANNSLSSAYNLRTINSTLNLGGLSIHPSGDTDWFKFTLDRTPVRGQAVRIDFNNYEGNLSLELLNSAGNSLGTSTTSNNFEEISLYGKGAGTYYVKVSGASSTVSNPEYSLTVTGIPELRADQLEPNDTPAQAYDLRDLADIANNGRNRSFTDTVEGQTYLNGGQTGLLPGVGVRFPNVNSGGRVGFSSGFGGGYGGIPVSFRPISPQQDAYNAFLLREDQRKFQQSLYNLQLSAYYSQQSHQRELSQIPIRQQQQNQQIQYELSQNDRYGQNAVLNITQGLQFAGINLPNFGGNFYTFPQSQNYGSTYPSYNTPNSYGSNNHYIPASNDGIRLFSQLFGPNYSQSLLGLTNLSIHTATDQDWFKFTLDKDGEAGQFVAINFDNDLGDLKLELFETFNTTNPVEVSNSSGDSEEISLAGLAKGTYYVKVSGATTTTTNPDYTLLVNAPPPLETDWIDTQNTSTYDLREVDGNLLLSNLSIHNGDTDTFKFTTIGTGKQGHTVRIDFSDT